MWLECPDGQIDKGKHAVMRVMLAVVNTQTGVTLEAAGSIAGARPLVLPAGCGPGSQRRRFGSCATADFPFTPGDLVEVTLTLKLDATGQVLDKQSFKFNSVQTRNLRMVPVEVCDAIFSDTSGLFIASCGDWQKLPELLGLLRSSAPTAAVNPGFFIEGRQTVRLDASTYASGVQWWQDAVNEIQSLAEEGGAETGTVYYGMVRSPGPPGAGGIGNIPGNAAMSVESDFHLGKEVNYEAVAHETGHALGRRHLNVPVTKDETAPGCWGTAVDPGTDWPYSDPSIQEVGFNLAATDPTAQVLLAGQTFDWMSYCTPQWISPFTYKKVIESLRLPSSSSGSAAAALTSAG